MILRKKSTERMLGAEGITSHDYPRGCQAMGPGSGILAGGWARGLGGEEEEEEPGGDRGDGGHPHVADIGGHPGGGVRGKRRIAIMRKGRGRK